MAQNGFRNSRQGGGEVGLSISKNGELTGRVEETSEAPTDHQAIYLHPLTSGHMLTPVRHRVLLPLRLCGGPAPRRQTGVGFEEGDSGCEAEEPEPAAEGGITF